MGLSVPTTPLDRAWPFPPQRLLAELNSRGSTDLPPVLPGCDDYMYKPDPNAVQLEELNTFPTYLIEKDRRGFYGERFEKPISHGTYLLCNPDGTLRKSLRYSDVAGHSLHKLALTPREFVAEVDTARIEAGISDSTVAEFLQASVDLEADRYSTFKLERWRELKRSVALPVYKVLRGKFTHRDLAL